jgi:hypothetical protein
VVLVVDPAPYRTVVVAAAERRRVALMADVNWPKLDAIKRAVQCEMIRATQKHAPMHSWHEAHSVIREEFEEFWAEVMKGGSTPRDPVALRTELTQLAAMCFRAMHDLSDDQY